jgi:uncharacterized Zn finger protein (UPF0148 family)
MRTRVPDQVTCPICGVRKTADAKRMPLSLEAKLREREKTQSKYVESGWSVSLARHGRLVWACDECLAAKRALKARPWLQTYCCDTPLFAYVDSEATCRTCGLRFTFSAAEKRRWYEGYKFILASHPVNCLPCRRAKRVIRGANQALEKALCELDPRSVEQLVEVSSLYLKMGATKKAVEFLRRAKNLSRDQEEVAELLERASRIQFDEDVPEA